MDKNAEILRIRHEKQLALAMPIDEASHNYMLVNIKQKSNHKTSKFQNSIFHTANAYLGKSKGCR
jgi:hypothetical protein